MARKQYIIKALVVVAAGRFDRFDGDDLDDRDVEVVGAFDLRPDGTSKWYPY